MGELTPEQTLQVLRRYGAGAELKSISADLRVEHELVVAVVTGLGFNRQAAAERIRSMQARPEPKQQKDPEPQQQKDPPGTADALLKAAEAAGGTLAARAHRIRANLTSLEDDLTVHRAAAAVRRRIDEARTRVREAEAELRRLNTKPKQKKAIDSRAVRAWAAENGLHAGAVGQLPAAVIDAWKAAHGG